MKHKATPEEFLMHVDASAFFWQKMQREVVSTIIAAKPWISQNSIDSASRNFCTDTIKIRDYIVLLRIWKIVRLKRKKPLTHLK